MDERTSLKLTNCPSRFDTPTALHTDRYQFKAITAHSSES